MSAVTTESCAPTSGVQRFVEKFSYTPFSERYGKPIITIKLGRVFSDSRIDVRFSGFVRELDKTPLRMDAFSIIRVDEHELLAADKHILPTGYDVSEDGKTLTVFFNPQVPGGTLSDRILNQVLAAAMNRLVGRIEAYCDDVSSRYQIDGFTQAVLPL